ncbi:Mus7/MMS22 family-domain-containing protein [Neurospora hispaniola]|uniref:Mus7/MMS22 family-domain-containing protein n=1 Tax=Neurospora hispaniola TaxID=588809 RepID=A0AAJ0I5N0_9PEZI|nr:Mus7/MMS22 family-domain-containing protein [Neurospora hispaniola]
MKNWRELGEVPGSDEDDDSSFDDDDIDIDNLDQIITEAESPSIKLPESAVVGSAGNCGKEHDIPPSEGEKSPATEDVDILQAPQDEPQHFEKPKPAVDDIWDIPNSPITRNSAKPTPAPQPVNEPPRKASPVPSGKPDDSEDSPLSPAKSDIWSLSSLSQSQDATNTDLPVLEVRIPQTIPGREAYVKEDIPKSPTREDPTPTPSSPSLDGTISPRSRQGSQARSDQPRSDGSTLDDIEDGARRTGRRSLRPRKPIQQHPYLLENVRYAKVMKSHGIKPIKVVLEDAQRKRKAHEEDSQEQDFVGEESQETTRGEPTQVTEESGPILWDDDDELALSPSPLKTSSPARHLRASSVLNSGNQTDITALSDAEEFPDLDSLLSRPSEAHKKPLKRQSSTLLSAQRKKQRTASKSPLTASPIGRFRIPPVSIWDISPSPTTPRAPVESSQDLGLAQRPDLRRLTRSPSASRAEPVQPVESRQEPVGSPIFIRDDSDSPAHEKSDMESLASSHHSDSESDVIRETSRKIRGVLPASWLRLDQKKDGPTARHNARKDHDPPIDRLNRKGVALPKQTSPKRLSATQFPFDLAGESEEEATQAQNRPPISRSSPTRPTRQVITLEDDDDGFMIEEDSIDAMLAGRRKRAGSPSLSRGAKKQKSSSKATRQPKITQSFSGSKSGSGSLPSAKGTEKTYRKPRAGASINPSSRKRAATPPLLSILDVIEPNAPKFLKIAARSVKKRSDLGKSSPTKKAIRFGNRQDNIDALSTLRDWKSGKTRPRVAAPPRKKPASKSTRAVLGEVSHNVERQPSSTQLLPSSLLPRKLVVKKASVGKPVTNNVDGPGSMSRQPSRTTIHERGPVIRQAQLETSVYEDPQKRLKNKKRSLDALFRQTRKAQSAPSLDRLQPILDNGKAASPEPFALEGQVDSVTEVAPAVPKIKAANDKSRYRKRRAPQHVDVEAPQYTRADDPLPTAFAVVEEQAQQKDVDKLSGLGPYGTQYTHHFEVFPLDHGTFFHESTIIGRGYVKKAVEPRFSEKIRRPRPAVSFLFQGQSLSWGMWDDQVSSELGILVDWVAEQLEAGSKDDAEFAARQATDAANYLLEYVLDALRVQDDIGEKAFVSRWLEVMASFVGRFEALDWRPLREQTKKTALDIATRLSLAMLPVYMMAQSSGDDPIQSMKLEGLLTKLCKIAITGALSCGLEDVRTLYGELQRPTFRERGIRPNQVLAVCWAVLMQILESAGIPRNTFWDVVHSVMLTPEIVSGSDAQVFERLWQDMFTLLPLGEIDQMGILLPGLRNTVPLEGWTLPQKLMKRVFELYKSNQRQSPSFNEYCRALIGRCYFLVQQWGWRRCTGIIGTIFDFFGSQNLCHLRNEQVYKSPRFLEELANNPSLAIEPEDRCFHIFIKLLALAIQHLRQLGRTKDIRNLVTRTLPNHDRQYLKEDTIHERDLAALRNHHDLLCTLFWAAPPDLRPRVDLIERLITPSNAHKEACLINIRAWSQLARLVVSNGEGSAAFRPFITWRNDVFNQILDQYMSAESDIEQQFRALSAEHMRSIDAAWREELITKNKATALDILHTSARASLDVLKQAKTLEAAIYTLNVTQLQKMCTTLHFGSPGFDWGILNVALDTHAHFLGWIEKSSEEQYSSNESSADIDPRQLEDAILLLQEKLTKEFFWMARELLALPLKAFTTFGKQTQQVACTEKTVTLAAKLAARFIQERVTQVLPYFQPGKYGLFPDIPKNMSSPERRWLPLFIGTLVNKNVFDFKDIETNILSLWVQSIIKPMRFLGYETYLAEVLQQRGLPFLAEADVSAGMTPDYNIHLDLFSRAIHYMRKALRGGATTSAPGATPGASTAGSSSAQFIRRQREEFSHTLQLAMTNIRKDLSLLRSLALADPTASSTEEHRDYMAFTHGLISLIKSHGVGIVVVDSFFLTPSDSYSPPLQDPQLHTAGIMAYGVRLSEKDVPAASQLFWYLFNNFKVALANDGLKEERGILERALGDDKVTGGKEFMTFMLEVMLPVVVQVAGRVDEQDGEGEFGSVLLECYAGAVVGVLTRSCVPRELKGEDVEVHVVEVLRSVVWWCEEMWRQRERGAEEVKRRDLALLNQLVGLCVALQPSIIPAVITLRSNTKKEQTAQREEKVKVLVEVVEVVSKLFDGARACIRRFLFSETEDWADVAERPGVETLTGFIRVECLLEGLPPTPSSQQARVNPRMQGHVTAIVKDMSNNWMISDGRVTTRFTAAGGPARVPGQQQQQRLSSSTQSTTGATPARSQGTGYTVRDREELLWDLYARLGEWRLGEGSDDRRGYQLERRILWDDEMFMF